MNLKYHDAHVHLSTHKMFSKLDELRKKWTKVGVQSCQIMSMTLHESKRSLSMSMTADDLFAGVGKHPWKVKKTLTQEEKSEFEILVKDNRCKIIGEVGLDQYFVKDSSRFIYQKETLEFFISLAIENKKPLNVHTTNAESTLVDLFENQGIDGRLINIHWYSGPDSELQKLINLGCFFSVGPAIYYSRHKKVVEKVPIERLLTESDGDVKYKSLGIVGEPAHIPMVVEKISEMKSIDLNELTSILFNNAMRYLRIIK
ncbi:MAG: TatD family hydrolase [Candidatus Hodarchaeales archaeon]|jgi:TatD DNase family protein